MWDEAKWHKKKTGTGKRNGKHMYATEAVINVAGCQPESHSANAPLMFLQACHVRMVGS